MNPESDAMGELNSNDTDFTKKFFGKYCKGFKEADHKFIERIKITDLCINLQEFSRRSMNWPILKLGKFERKNDKFKFENSLIQLDVEDISIPEEVYSILMNNENIILAGGAVLDSLIGFKVKDYDLFCIGNRPTTFRTDNWLETSNSISTLNKPMIQLIKRIYDNPQQVIGGFDLDSSRFYMDSDLNVFTTLTGIAALIHRINPINFCCYSSSFSRRIRKYRRKGFIPIYVNKSYHDSDTTALRYYKKFQIHNKEHIYFGDYDVKLSHNSTIPPEHKLKLLNFCCLMRGEFDGFCVLNGTVFKKEDFIEFAKQQRIKELNIKAPVSRFRYGHYKIQFKYYLKRNHLFPKSDVANSFVDLRIPEDTPRDLVVEYIYQMRLENIEKNYPFYTSIVDKFRITNPGSQHTSSFHPVQFKTLEEHSNFKKNIFKKDYIPHDSSSPDIVAWLICSKSLKLPKPIVFNISTFVYAFKLIDILDLRNSDKKVSINFPKLKRDNRWNF